MNLEGKGGVSGHAAIFLKGVEPQIGAVDVEVAASEVLRAGIAPPLTLPSSGVVGAGNMRGMQVEELTNRRRHRTHKTTLKEAGFQWASKKKLWYYRPEQYRSRARGNVDMDDIRTKYGSSRPATRGFDQLQRQGG